MSHSDYFEQARNYLACHRGQPLSLQKRKEAATELAALILQEANRQLTSGERTQQEQLAGMMEDSHGKTFTLSMTDQCFRSKRSRRVADQLTYLIKKYGIPRFLPFHKRLGLWAFRLLGSWVPGALVPAAAYNVRQEMKRVIVPAEDQPLAQYMGNRKRQGVKVNLNHLGEAILGEEEAARRLETYLTSLAKPDVDYVSIKISTLYSQIALLDWEGTLETLAERLRRLFRAAIKHPTEGEDGVRRPKFVNLDMEEYRDLHLTVALFRKVLDEPEFHHFSAGIVLQAYLPDAYLLQQELTVWAMRRVASGGAPVKLRLVKGANLAMEKVEAALNDWPQAPYGTKQEVDANFKRMLHYAVQPDHAAAVRLGVGSHNLLDVAYALILRGENGLEEQVGVEMLEGMADHLRRVVQGLSQHMVLYSPAVKREEFQNAVTYLIRRLDENTAKDNFLRHSFGLEVGSRDWQEQVERFQIACQSLEEVGLGPNRHQDRFEPVERLDEKAFFHNDAPTDFTLEHNRQWAARILEERAAEEFPKIPLVIEGRLVEGAGGEGVDPSRPEKPFYTFALATSEQVQQALHAADVARESWSNVTVEDRVRLGGEIAHALRQRRGRLISAMVADGGKVVSEADVEVCEAIDFVEFYRRSLKDLAAIDHLNWEPLGTVLVTPPWNFPCAIPLGGVVAALLGGNTVIFKPARETVLVAWELMQALWDAGVPKEVVQFLPCHDDPMGSQLVKDNRVSAVILTGASETARHFLRMRPGLHLMAETGGKNAMIVTSMADRDLAIKSLVMSAFGHGGQKCSACSLAILEAEVYDDPQFLAQLRDAAASLKVGSAWDPATKINPLIHPPRDVLLRGLTHLESGEEWLLTPKQDAHNPRLWSPGIKLGVKEGGFTHQTEFFGPLLGVMRADNLRHAIAMANSTPYGLTAGLQSLDEREQKTWMESIEAGNCYINRGITGAIVRRQPFGGLKDSAFGKGIKAGGPNYMTQMMRAAEFAPPSHQSKLSGVALDILALGEKMMLPDEEITKLEAALRSYSFWWNTYYRHEHDPSLLLGQDNLLSYHPKKGVRVRLQRGDRVHQVLYLLAASGVIGGHFELSLNAEHVEAMGGARALNAFKNLTVVEELEEAFIARAKTGGFRSLRLLTTPSQSLLRMAGVTHCQLVLEPPVANGRLELLNWLQEISLSLDYHRYGNLGDREGEPRSSVV